MGLITGLRAKIDVFRCESHDGRKSILQAAAFLCGRLVPPYNQVMCSRHVLIDFVVVLCQIGLGGEFLKTYLTVKGLIWGYRKKKTLKFCDLVSEACFGLHTCAASCSSCPLLSVPVVSCCNQLFTAGARLNRWADKRKGKKDCG